MTEDDYRTVREAATGVTDLVDVQQVLAALMLLRRLREELAGWEPRLIATARGLGASWVELAPALGVASRQAAERRYLRLHREHPGSTGDERVRAERDRRAGDRAVSAWARDNAAVLRTLAGQVGATDSGVREALADNDAAALLAPLQWARTQLDGTRPDLAAQIDRVTAHTDQIRRDTHTRRAPAHQQGSATGRPSHTDQGTDHP